MPTLHGVINHSLSVDEEGHREYTVDYLVEADYPGQDGPAIAYNTPGLPLVGSAYSIGNDFDSWAFCKWNTTIGKFQVNEGEPGQFYKVTKIFSTKPFKRCNEIQIENPLLQPPKISGSFNKVTREEPFDRFGKLVTNSAHELFRGPQTEYEHYDLTINIEMNVPLLLPALVSSLINKVNSTTMWGFAPRRIKFSKFDFDEVYWGVCYKYYVWKMGFEIPAQGFDRYLLDEGTKVLNGTWDTATGNYVIRPIPGVTSTPNPDPSNPQHFIRFADRVGNKTNVILNGAGLPSGVYVDGERTATIVDEQDISNGVRDPLFAPTFQEPGGYDIVGQPTQETEPSELLIKITDPDYFLEAGAITIHGAQFETNPDTGEIETIEYSETINFSFPPLGTHIYKTQNKYYIVYGIYVSTPLQTADASNKIEVYVNDKVQNVGYRYVEFYQGANLLQLGIPSIIGP